MFDAICHATTFEHERSTNKDFCIPYDKKSMAGHSTALDQLVDQYFPYSGLKDLLPNKSPKTAITAEARIKRELRSLFWHFLQAMRVHDDCYVRICLREISYRNSPTENPHGISREIGKVVSALEECGAITRCKGFLDRKSGKSKTTRIRPRLTLLEDLKMLPTDISEALVEPPAVCIRRGMPEDLDHASAQHIERMQKTVSDYNEFMRSHTVKIPDARNGVLLICGGDGRPHWVNASGRTLTAIYHANDPGKLCYGRIHGGAWQVIPAPYRKTILLDGQDTVELDYSAQVVHIVAGLEGIQLTGDPYAIPLPFTDYDADFAREVVKSAIVIMLNTSNLKAMNGALRNKFRDDPRTKNCPILPKPIRECILAHHPFLKDYAMKGIGKDLFMHDAEIARQIIQTFLDAGKVVLPIHDGFVAKHSDQDFLRETMERVWFEMFGTTIPIKVAN